MSSVRLRRLTADFERLRDYAKRHPRLRLIQADGDPPERYQLEYRIKSLRQVDGDLKVIKSHIVEITLPRNYPRTPPQCRMLSPVFHPNIAPHAICVGDHWSAGESLQSIVTRIGEMLAYQSYNVKSPLNGEAARWVAENEDDLPLDRVSMLVEEADEPDDDESGELDDVISDNSPSSPVASARNERGSASGTEPEAETYSLSSRSASAFREGTSSATRARTDKPRQPVAEFGEELVEDDGADAAPIEADEIFFEEAPVPPRPKRPAPPPVPTQPATRPADPATERFTVACPQCARQFRVPGSYIGRKAECQSCGHKFIIPSPE